MSSSARGMVLLAIFVRKRHRAVLCWAFTRSYNFPFLGLSPDDQGLLIGRLLRGVLYAHETHFIARDES